MSGPLREELYAVADELLLHILHGVLDVTSGWCIGQASSSWEPSGDHAWSRLQEDQAWLGVRTVVSAGAVCWRWRRVALDESLWVRLHWRALGGPLRPDWLGVRNLRSSVARYASAVSVRCRRALARSELTWYQAFVTKARSMETIVKFAASPLLALEENLPLVPNATSIRSCDSISRELCMKEETKIQLQQAVALGCHQLLDCTTLHQRMIEISGLILSSQLIDLDPPQMELHNQPTYQPAAPMRWYRNQSTRGIRYRAGKAIRGVPYRARQAYWADLEARSEKEIIHLKKRLRELLRSRDRHRKRTRRCSHVCVSKKIYSPCTHDDLEAEELSVVWVMEPLSVRDSSDLLWEARKLLKGRRRRRSVDYARRVREAIEDLVRRKQPKRSKKKRFGKIRKGLVDWMNCQN